jgi:hypothetical protein
MHFLIGVAVGFALGAAFGTLATWLHVMATRQPDGGPGDRP